MKLYIKEIQANIRRNKKSFLPISSSVNQVILMEKSTMGIVNAENKVSRGNDFMNFFCQYVNVVCLIVYRP